MCTISIVPNRLPCQLFTHAPRTRQSAPKATHVAPSGLPLLMSDIRSVDHAPVARTHAHTHACSQLFQAFQPACSKDARLWIIVSCARHPPHQLRATIAAVVCLTVRLDDLGQLEQLGNGNAETDQGKGGAQPCQERPFTRQVIACDRTL